MGRPRKYGTLPETGERAGNTETVAPDDQGTEGQGSDTPPSAPETPETGERAGNAGTKPPEGGKVRIRHPGKAGKKLFVGAKLVQFDAEGIVELDEADAAILLGLKSGYEEA